MIVIDCGELLKALKCIYDQSLLCEVELLQLIRQSQISLGFHGHHRTCHDCQLLIEYQYGVTKQISAF